MKITIIPRKLDKLNISIKSSKEGFRYHKSSLSFSCFLLNLLSTRHFYYSEIIEAESHLGSKRLFLKS